MTRFKIVKLFDKIFISVCLFLIIYAWINFFIRDLWTTFILSLFFSAACSFLLFYLFNKKHTKIENSKKHLNDAEEMFLAFRLMSNHDRINFLKSIIEKHHKCHTNDHGLTYSKGNKTYQIYVFLEKEKLSQFDLENIISKKEKEIEILQVFCSSIEVNLNTKILKDLEIQIIPKNKIYDEYFLPNNILPDCSNLNNKNERKKFYEIAKNFFLPHKAKSYFVCGLILIFSSIILPYHYYYLIFGTVLLIFSVVCKLMPTFIL